jgi:hypothetical protein
LGVVLYQPFFLALLQVDLFSHSCLQSGWQLFFYQLGDLPYGQVLMGLTFVSSLLKHLASFQSL